MVVESFAPLSYGQQGMLLFQSGAPPGALNNHIPIPLGRAPVDQEAVVELLRLLQVRNDALRCRLVARGGRIGLAFADPDDAAPVELVGEHAPGLGRWALKPFPRGAMPRVRAQLRERDGVAWLRLTADPLVCDGWSTGVVKREVVAVWTHLLNGTPITRTPGSFLSYLRHRAQRRSVASLDAYRRHWQAEFAQDVKVALPRRDDADSYVLSFAVPVALSRAVRELRRRCNTTDVGLFTAAFATALGRMASQRSMLLHMEAIHRDMPDAVEAVGCFLNHVGVRVEVGPGFGETLASAQAGIATALRFQDGPFYEVAARAGVAEDDGAVAVVTPHGYVEDVRYPWSEDCSLPTSLQARIASGDAEWLLEKTSSPPLGDVYLGFKAASWGYVTNLCYRGTYLSGDAAHELARQFLGVLEEAATAVVPLPGR